MCKLQVTEAGKSAIELRLLLTSASSGRNWHLRCSVREALDDFMQREYPQYLPLMRAELAETAYSGKLADGAEGEKFWA